MCGEDIFHCCIFRLIFWEYDCHRPADAEVAKTSPSRMGALVSSNCFNSRANRKQLPECVAGGLWQCSPAAILLHLSQWSQVTPHWPALCVIRETEQEVGKSWEKCPAVGISSYELATGGRRSVLSKNWFTAKGWLIWVQQGCGEGGKTPDGLQLTGHNLCV